MKESSRVIVVLSSSISNGRTSNYVEGSKSVNLIFDAQGYLLGSDHPIVEGYDRRLWSNIVLHGENPVSVLPFR